MFTEAVDLDKREISRLVISAGILALLIEMRDNSYVRPMCEYKLPFLSMFKNKGYVHTLICSIRLLLRDYIADLHTIRRMLLH